MRRYLIMACALSVLSLNFSVDAAPQAHSGHHSAYGGQQHRAIKSLSPEDVAELRRGGGWGLAKAAELNGMPGPAHLLELKDQIVLKPEQAASIRALFNEMRQQAIAKGEELSDEDFKEKLEALNEELEVLNAEARELEERIADNVVEILEAS